MAQITLSIPDEKVDEFLECFVEAEPMPVLEEKITPAQWFRAWLRMKAFQAYQKGKKKLATVEIDEDIIT